MTVCRRYVSDKDAAKDVLQESLIRVFSKIDTYKSFGSFEGWMRKITVRCALAYLDRKDVRREVPMLTMNDEEVKPIAFSNLEAEELLNLIKELPTGFRKVFNLNAIEGYSHKEIGKMLGITESASRSQLSRARQLLSKRYFSLQEIKIKKSV